MQVHFGITAASKDRLLMRPGMVCADLSRGMEPTKVRWWRCRG
jgi:hypothetical protein